MMTSSTSVMVLCVAVLATVQTQRNPANPVHDPLDSEENIDSLLNDDVLGEPEETFGEPEVVEEEDEEIDADLEEMDSELDMMNEALKNDPLKDAEKDETTLKTKKRDPKCPRSFIYDASTSMCFKVFTPLISVFKAKIMCKKTAEGGRLVELNTAGKLAVVSHYIEEKKLGSRDGFSLGGSSSGRDVYKWNSGGEIGFWCPGSPNRGKSCLLLASKPSGMCVTDGCCYHPRHYVCEIPM